MNLEYVPRTCENVYYLFVEMYVRDVKAGTTLPDGEPVIDKETVSTALVNANNILGPVSRQCKCIIHLSVYFGRLPSSFVKELCQGCGEVAVKLLKLVKLLFPLVIKFCALYGVSVPGFPFNPGPWVNYPAYPALSTPVGSAVFLSVATLSISDSTGSTATGSTDKIRFITINGRFSLVSNDGI